MEHWNGTHVFPKTTILFSIDGLRADYLDRQITPTLQSFVNSGVAPEYMIPTFPSVTFTNHWSIVTGLYAESHGIVGNAFWDPNLNKQFHHTNPEESLQQEWWGGEPIWMTAESQGLRSAVHMWPGSEARGWGATFVDKFNQTEALNKKVDRVLEWLDLPAPERPHFIAAYVPDVDDMGHKFGPNAAEVNDAMKSVDSMVHDLFIGLENRNLTEIVNIVIVSDHGMAGNSKERLIYIEDIVDLSKIEHIHGLPLYGLRPYPNQDLMKIYESIKEKELSGEGSTWKVYLRDSDMPTRWHFSQNPRIAPLWIIPKTGWTIVKKSEYLPGSKKEFDIGDHGYDNHHPMMRATFVARGPAFRHLHGEGRQWLALDRKTGEIKKDDTNQTKGEVRSTRVDPFENVEVYRLLCQSLGIKESAMGTNATMKVLVPISADGSVGKSSYSNIPNHHQANHPLKL